MLEVHGETDESVSVTVSSPEAAVSTAEILSPSRSGLIFICHGLIQCCSLILVTM